MVRDPQLDAAYRNLEELRDKLQQAEEKLFNVGLYIAIYANTETELNQIETEVKGMLDTRLVYLKPALFQQDDAFLSIIPTLSDKLLVHSKFNSSPLSSFFPFTSFDLTSDTGILYGINRQNGSLILFDRFKLTNYNSVTFATSGAGKSFTTKLEILRSLMFGVEVIVIDPEHEYEFLTVATGGNFFNISLSSKHHINPFDLPIPLSDEDPKDLIRSHIIELIGLFRLMLGGLTPKRMRLLITRSMRCMRLKTLQVLATTVTSPHHSLPTFGLVLAGMEGSESLVQRLTKYTSGSWAGFMNESTNVDINQKFVVFSLRDMEEELKDNRHVHHHKPHMGRCPP